MLRSYRSHLALEAYDAAARSSGLPLRMFSFTDHETSAYLRLPVSARNLLNPWMAARTVGPLVRAGMTLLLREFLTVPFLLAAPIFLRWRKRLWLVSVHNVQRAVRRPVQRQALKGLARLGFRFVLPESRAGIERLGFANDARQFRTVPLGLTEAQAGAPRVTKLTGRVAVVGRIRVEKNFDEALSELQALREGSAMWRPVVGTTDERVLEESRRRGLEAVDTTSEAAYRELLASSSVVLLNYSIDDYEYRTSGVILDAAAAHAAVVCPDFPVFRDQISNPVSIGFPFRDSYSLRQSVTEAAQLAANPGARFGTYLEARSPNGLGASLRELALPADAAKSESRDFNAGR